MKQLTGHNLVKKVDIAAFGAQLLLGLIALITVQVVKILSWEAVAPFCILSIIILIIFSYKKIRQGLNNLLSEPIIFFALSSALYFGFGPLLYVFGPVEGSEYSLSWYPTAPNDGLWLIGLNLIGIGIAGLFASLCNVRSISRLSRIAAVQWSKISIEKTYILFLCVGVSAKYIFVIPSEFGFSSDSVSTLMSTLQHVTLAAIFIGWARYSPKRWILLTAQILLVVDLLSGMLMFNKTEAVLAVLCAGVGNYLNKKRVRDLLLVPLSAMFFFISFGPVVGFARNEIYSQKGDIAVVGFLDRANLIEKYIKSDGALKSVEIQGAWWSRLNYIPAQKAAVDLYDKHRGSDDFKMTLWTLVPRIVYPDKPILSETGFKLTQQVNGLTTSSAGIGIFTDGYYNFGWLGVIFFSITYGVSLGIFASIARPIIDKKSLFLYPLALIGHGVAIGSDQWWIINVPGKLVIALPGLLIFFWLKPSRNKC